MEKFNMTGIDDKTLMLNIFGGSRHEKNRILYPQNPDIVDEVVFDHFNAVKKLGKHIVLVDGAFDVPHPAHDWYLRHCKTEGALEKLLEEEGDLKFEKIKNTLANKAIHLAVTIDSDYRVQAKKSSQEKGGVQRPIYPWKARAEQLLSYNFSLDDKINHVVDTATVEGDPIHKDTCLERTVDLADFLNKNNLLDTTVIFGEHYNTIKDYNEKNINPVVIPVDCNYELRPNGKPWHSSDIIKKSQGKIAHEGATRPEVDDKGYLL